MTADTGSTPSQPSKNKFCLHSAPKGYPKGATVCKVAAAWPQPGVDYSSTLVEDDSAASVTIVRSPSQLARSKTTVRGRTKKAGSKEATAAWWDESLIDANNGVTLTLTLQITAAHMKEKIIVQSLLALADSNIYVWGAYQPSVLLIQVDSSSDEDISQLTQTIQMIKDTFAPSSDTSSSHLKNSLVAIVNSYEPTVSRKGLLNMATFAAPTRWIVSGLEVERGLVLSKEVSMYAMREAKVYADMPGHVLVIPQFASTRDDTRSGQDTAYLPNDRLIYSSIGAELLPSIRGKQTMVSNLSEYDCVKCIVVEEGVEEEGEEENGSDDDELDDQMEPDRRRRLTDTSFEKNVEEILEDLWWDLSVADVYGTPGGFNGKARASLEAMAKIHANIEHSLISLLDRKGEHLDYLRYFDKSPILLVDRLGPTKEMMTLDLAPEVEDFSGRKCFNLLRFAQLAALGKKLFILQYALSLSVQPHVFPILP